MNENTANSSSTPIYYVTTNNTAASSTIVVPIPTSGAYYIPPINTTTTWTSIPFPIKCGYLFRTDEKGKMLCWSCGHERGKHRINHYPKDKDGCVECRKNPPNPKITFFPNVITTDYYNTSTTSSSAYPYIHPPVVTLDVPQQ